MHASTTLQDLGRSAYLGEHRKNPDRHALAVFLKLVEAGKIPRGSYLILENLDRLSREHIQPALLLALGLLQAGVRIVQLKPSEMVFDDKSDTMPVMMMMMELSRGHGESRIKSERVGAAWAEKKRLARTGEVLTRRLPGWIEERGGKLHLIPANAATVKQIFALAASGYGTKAIVRRLNEDRVAAFGRSGRWVRSYVQDILVDRRAVGELQPRRSRDGEADGEAIADYYPAAVSEQDWLAARAGAAKRRRIGGGRTSFVNIFQGLLRHARDGDTYYCNTRAANHPRRGRSTWRVLVTGASEGCGACWSFPCPTFEQAILSKLAELDPREVLGKSTGPDEVAVLSGELAGVASRIAEIEGELLKGDVAALARVLRGLEAKRLETTARLAAARENAAHPLKGAWGEAQTLLQALDGAKDPCDVRLRLRSALRRMIDSIWLLVVPRGLGRIAAVQIWFADGKRHRDYLIFHRPANIMARQERLWWVRSLAEVTAHIDLRKPTDARELEKTLGLHDPASLAANSVRQDRSRARQIAAT